jgi:pantoate--beta-alanine ligase
VVRIVKTIAALQRLARQWQRTGTPVAFVPTMGYLHRGHLSLIRKARQCAGRKGRVVVSIYVNPTQFGPDEDLVKYPRDLPRDKRLCAAAGADVVFTPTTGEMFPAGFSTWVVEEKLARGMEGASRPAHFRGVATVVAKLFQIVRPGFAVFGAKDFQQSAIIRRMARDLNFPVKIVVAPTVREADGLAMSSRNKYLSPAQRRQASVLWRAMQKAGSRVAKRPVSATVVKQELRRLIASEPEARLDYIAFYNPDTLEPEKKIRKGTRIALAVYIGKTRLIDNAKL